MNHYGYRVSWWSWVFAFILHFDICSVCLPSRITSYIKFDYFIRALKLKIMKYKTDENNKICCLSSFVMSSQIFENKNGLIGWILQPVPRVLSPLFGTGVCSRCITVQPLCMKDWGRQECSMQSSSCLACCVLTLVPKAICHIRNVWSQFQYKNMVKKGNLISPVTLHFPI